MPAQKVSATFKCRAILALLLTFFPCALLFPLSYPTREVIALCAWVAVLPSPAGILSLALLLLFVNETYSYFAFNAFCVAATAAVALSLAHSRVITERQIEGAHKLARRCIVASLVLAVWQALAGEAWQRVFTDMISIGHGRGGGLRTEPSLLAAPLALYLALLALRRSMAAGNGENGRRGASLLEATAVIVAAVSLTRSLTVVIVAFCFMPAMGVKVRYALMMTVSSAGAVSVLMWERIERAVAVSGGSLAYLITTGVSSWRNVPDIVILSNPGEYLWPGDPAAIRDNINALAALWDPQYYWLANTYSTFSACASTCGLAGTALLFAAGLWIGLRSISGGPQIWWTWNLLYIANWFVLPKYEASGWVALSLLCVGFPLAIGVTAKREFSRVGGLAAGSYVK